MTHFSDEEFVDLLDGALPPARRAHLERCDACAAQARAMDGAIAHLVESGSGQVPEPSPLFWDHLSSRVADAVATPPASTWRDRLWWPGMAWATGLASIALAVAVSHAVLPRGPLASPPSAVLRSAAPPPAISGRAGEARVEPADDIETDEAWALVRSLADEIEWDEAHDAGISARPDAAERMTLELSTREQSELAHLLRRELRRQGS